MGVLILGGSREWEMIAGTIRRSEAGKWASDDQRGRGQCVSATSVCGILSLFIYILFIRSSGNQTFIQSPPATRCSV